MKTGTAAFLLFMLFCLHGFGSEKSESGILIDGTSSSAESAVSEPIAHEEALLYDASELPISKPENPVRAELLKSVPEQFRIYVEDFSVEELDIFLKKKNAYIEKLVTFMQKSKKSPEKIEKMVTFVETQFYKSSRLLLQANSTGGQYKFLIRSGFAFNSDFLSKFKISQTRLMKYLSSKKGYFYLFSGGFGLSRVIDPKTNKAHLILDLMVTKEDLKSVTSYIAELVSVDLVVLGLILEVRKGNFNSVFFDRGKFEHTSSYLGIGGRLGRNLGLLSHEVPISIPLVTSVALPPLASVFSIFDANATVSRYSINLSQLHPEAIANGIRNLFMRSSRANSQCLAFYAQ